MIKKQAVIYRPELFRKRSPQNSPVLMGATKLQIFRSNIKQTVCRIVNKLGVPGFIADTEIKDSLTGQEIVVKTGHLFTRITINGRDYYFERLTGKFGGTGYRRLLQTGPNSRISSVSRSTSCSVTSETQCVGS